MMFEDVGRPLAYEAAFFMESFTDPSLEIEELGDLSVTIGGKLRSLAIMALLSKGDQELFGQNLTRSGRIRLAYLERLRRENVENDHHSASGRVDGLIDALASSDIPLAREIVKMSRVTWLEGSEYEDDFCYAQLIQGFVSEEMSEYERNTLIVRFERVLNGRPSARLDLCRALGGREQESFDEAFDNLIRERQAQIAADKARFQLEEPEVISQRLVFVEGLAVLRLASLFSLTTDAEYEFCPSIARLTEPFGVPEE